MADDTQESGVLSSLPDRPLTMIEAEKLMESDAGLTPLSVSEDEVGRKVVYTLWATLEKSDSTHILGYSEDAGGWVKVDSRDRDNWDLEEQNEIVHSFLNDEYGDRDKVSQATPDPDTGEIELSDLDE